MGAAPLLLRIASIILLLGFWQLGSSLWNNSLLPSPIEVLAVARAEWAAGALSQHLGATLRRVIVSFTVAMLIGGAIGLLMGRSKTADQLLDPWLIFFLNIPALVIIILFYVWFGLGEITAVLAIAVNKIPNVIVTLREGARTLNRDYTEMARSFDLSSRKMLLHIILPQLLPFFMVAARSGISLIWKIVLVVELLGRGDGVGFQLHLYFQLFDVSGILAYSISFILVMLAIEYAVLQPLEQRTNRWRQ
ncbi:MAG: ABC transporter permease [Gammaproteobacteria bacterium]|nr:ABC transporter permease [Gammaproteobacteria bacterium]